MGIAKWISEGKGPISRLYNRWSYNKASFRRLGLKQDDMHIETPVVKEAVRRLPDHIRDDRIWRQMRALDLSMKKRVLPESEWTIYEEDVSYLKPYLDEVLAEQREKKEWNSKDVEETPEIYSPGEAVHFPEEPQKPRAVDKEQEGPWQRPIPAWGAAFFTSLQKTMWGRTESA